MIGSRQWFATVEGANRCAPPAPLASPTRRSGRGGPSRSPGEPGEVAVRCDGQMVGFWTTRRPPRNGSSTASSDRRHRRLDERGYLYISTAKTE